MGLFDFVGDAWNDVKGAVGDVVGDITHPQDALGLTNKAQVTAPTLDPNAFQYGGQPGGAATAAGGLQAQGTIDKNNLTAAGAANQAQDTASANAARTAAAPTTNYANANADRSSANNAAGGQSAALTYQDQAAHLAANAAAGRGPSAADLELNKANNDAVATQLQLAAGARGPAALAAAQANAAGNVANVEQQNAAAAGIQRMREMQQGEQDLIGAGSAYQQGAGSIRNADLAQQSQDAQQAQYLASLQEAQNNLNAGTALGYSQLGQANALGYAGLGVQANATADQLANQINMGQLQAQMNQQQLAQQGSLQSQEDNAGIQAGNIQTAGNLISGGMGAGAGLASALIPMLSDERLKSGIAPAGGHDFTDNLQTPEGGLAGMATPMGVHAPEAPDAPGVAAKMPGGGMGGGGLTGMGNAIGGGLKSLEERLGIGSLGAGSGGSSGFGPSNYAATTRAVDNGPQTLPSTSGGSAGGFGSPGMFGSNFRITSDKEAKHEAYEAGKRAGVASIARAADVDSYRRTGTEMTPSGATVESYQRAPVESLPAAPAMPAGVPQAAGVAPDPNRAARMAALAAAAPAGPAPALMAAGGLARYAAPAAPPPITSDARRKTSLSEHTEADDFLDELHPYSYRYKDPADEPSGQPTGGRYLGVMAQDVEKGPTGRTIVKDTPRGKVLEGGALTSAIAAGVGRLNERVRELEAERDKRRASR